MAFLLLHDYTQIKTVRRRGWEKPAVASVLQAHLPQSSCPFLLVDVNEVAYHSSLNSAVLGLHSDLQIIGRCNVRRLACSLPLTTRDLRKPPIRCLMVLGENQHKYDCNAPFKGPGQTHGTGPCDAPFRCPRHPWHR